MSKAAIVDNQPEDLEALFDSIVRQQTEATQEDSKAAGSCSASHDAKACPAGKVLNRIGHMTRTLHESMRELGYDRLLERVASSIPDARDRLNYVAVMTEQAAQRALNATEAARPIQDNLAQNATRLAGLWDRLFERQLSVEQFKELVSETRVYLEDVPNRARATNEQLLEIMMAQDFQDLTGQVIKKITEIIQTLEKELLDLLLENIPQEKRSETAVGLVNGPVISAGGRSDVVTSQSQVDDLLESLGF